MMCSLSLSLSWAHPLPFSFFPNVSLDFDFFCHLIHFISFPLDPVFQHSGFVTLVFCRSFFAFAASPRLSLAAGRTGSTERLRLGRERVSPGPGVPHSEICYLIHLADGRATHTHIHTRTHIQRYHRERYTPPTAFHYSLPLRTTLSFLPRNTRVVGG